MNELWPKLPTNPVLGLSLIMTAVAVALYAAFVVVWRHDAQWKPGRSVYLVTVLLLLITVYLSHEGYRRAK